MKIRKGFVSNSSSSSFVCDVCDCVETGYDGMYDFPTTYCQGGHHFCSDHLEDTSTTEQMQECMLGDEYFLKELDPFEAFAVKNGDKDIVPDLYERFVESYDEVPKSMCPVCSLRVVSDNIIVSHLLDKFDLYRKDVEEEIRNKYGSLEGFEKR